ncbi:MAG: hypothetical protein AAGI23_15100 [Bacteroidota bacterium]
MNLFARKKGEQFIFNFYHPLVVFNKDYTALKMNKKKSQKPDTATEFQLVNDLIAAQVLTQMALRQEVTSDESTAHHQSDSEPMEIIAEAVSDELEVSRNPFVFYFKLARQLRQFLMLTDKDRN